MSSKPIVNSYLAVLVGVFAVSFSALFARLATAPALMIATYRLLFTFLFLAPYALLRYRTELASISWRQRGLASASGLCLALHLVTWFISLLYTSIASSVVLVTTQPVFVVIGSWIFFRERVSRLAMLGGTLALLGSFIIDAADFQIGREAFWGDLLALAAAVFVSGYLLIGRRLRGSVSLPAYTFYTYGSSALALVIASAASGTPFTPYPPRDWILFVALAIVCTVIGHTIFNWVLRYAQASVVSVSVLGEPLGAILWASIFLREYPTLRQTIGAGFIFGGLFIFTRFSAGHGSAAVHADLHSKQVTVVQKKTEDHQGAATGLGYWVLAYLVWGFFPAYFNALGAVPPLQVVCHRIVWSVLFLCLIIVWRGRWSVVRDALHDRRALTLLSASALLIATNWLVFIIAVGHAQVIQSSLGYFITPFVSVLLGFFFLQEHLRRLQIASLLLAAAGILLLTLQYGRFPWVAIILALTFGSYGLLRKIVTVDSLTGLTVETLLLAPPALAYLLFVSWQGNAAFPAQGAQTSSLLMLAGVATTVPLLLFASAARRLRLATIGFLQYITPTLHFLLAVLLYMEPFTRAHLTSFMFIWSGLCCYSYDAWRGMRSGRQNIG